MVQSGLDPASVDLWLVDGFNVLHACVLKGRDRARWWGVQAQLALLAWLEVFAEQHRVVVVFDAKSQRSERAAAAGCSTQLRFAAHADDAIVASLSGEFNTAELCVCVVSADRALGDRCRARGARVMRPWAFAALLPSGNRT